MHLSTFWTDFLYPLCKLKVFIFFSVLSLKLILQIQCQNWKLCCVIVLFFLSLLCFFFSSVIIFELLFFMCWNNLYCYISLLHFNHLFLIFTFCSFLICRAKFPCIVMVKKKKKTTILTLLLTLYIDKKI